MAHGSTAAPSALADHLAYPRGLGALARAPHTGAAGGAACGDLVRVSVRLAGDRVAEAGFEAKGCAAARAAGSAVVEMVEGAPALEAARLTPAAVAAELGGLAPGAAHAAELAADALHRALGSAARDGALALAPSAERTLVAMSGGVDSAAAAQLALDAGEDVVAVTLELWADPATDGESSCCSPQAVTGARALAHRMGVPHLTLDLRDRFRADVVDDFLAGYAGGDTPNPCVRCNGLVRFDAMLDLARALGSSRLATGHYARIADDGEGPLVRAAADPAKDQSYVLARLGGAELERLRFPLGGLDKPQVRDLAAAAGLPVARKPESQDLCFLAGTGTQGFLGRHGGERIRAAESGGDIVDRRGHVLGRHAGHHRFTVGQRRGIGVAAAEPLFVLAKDPERNRVVVGPRSELATTTVSMAPGALHREAGRARAVRLRYHSPAVPCSLTQDLPPGHHAAMDAVLGREVAATAAGQTACLMDGDLVVGWGTLAGRTGGLGVPDLVELSAPLDGDFGPVVRLIVGGISAGADLGFEEMDDLQLAIERLHAEAGGEGRLTLAFTLSTGRVQVRIGPLAERGMADALQREPVPGDLTLRRVLDTVVDSYGVEEASGGDLYIRVVKLVRG